MTTRSSWLPPLNGEAHACIVIAGRKPSDTSANRKHSSCVPNDARHDTAAHASPASPHPLHSRQETHSCSAGSPQPAGVRGPRDPLASSWLTAPTHGCHRGTATGSLSPETQTGWGSLHARHLREHVDGGVTGKDACRNSAVHAADRGLACVCMHTHRF